MKLSHSGELNSNQRPSSVCQVEPFQQTDEPAVVAGRLKERFDREQIDERCLILESPG
jgi:hypothetical protein